MACNFINVGGNSNSCKENYSGVGSTIYIFTKDDLDAVNLSPAYSDNAAIFTPESFAGLTVHKIAVKAKSGKVTATSNANAGGFSNVYTGLVANDMANMSAVARIMNNRNDWGVMVPAGSGKYYVLYDPDFDIEFSMESDTGDAPDSDHGHTVTITQSPMQYALPTWTPGSGQEFIVAEDGGSISTESATTAILQITSVDGTTVTATKQGATEALANKATAPIYRFEVEAGDSINVEVQASSTAPVVTWSDGTKVTAKSANSYKVTRTIAVDANGAAYSLSVSAAS